LEASGREGLGRETSGRSVSPADLQSSDAVQSATNSILRTLIVSPVGQEYSASKRLEQGEMRGPRPGLDTITAAAKGVFSESVNELPFLNEFSAKAAQ